MPAGLASPATGLAIWSGQRDAGHLKGTHSNGAVWLTNVENREYFHCWLPVDEGVPLAISVFNPVGSRSSNGISE